MSTLISINLGDSYTELRNNLNTNFDALNEDKVEKENGKGLSTNDFTTAYKEKVDAAYDAMDQLADDYQGLSSTVSQHTSKLAGIADGAQVNVLESIKLNGTAQTITNKSIDITFATMKAFFEKLSLGLDTASGRLTLSYNGTALTNGQVDTALELIVESGTYNPNTKSIVLTLANGSTIDIPAEELVDEYYADNSTITLYDNNGAQTFKIADAVMSTINKAVTDISDLKSRVSALESNSSGLEFIEWDSDKGYQYDEKTGLYSYSVPIAEQLGGGKTRQRVVVDILDGNGHKCFCDYSYSAYRDSIVIYSDIQFGGIVVVR